MAHPHSRRTVNSLPDEYDAAIVGRTVGPFATQLVYSLTRISQYHEGNTEEVRNLMKQAFVDHGAEAPVFLDDHFTEGDGDVAMLPETPDAPDTPKIITPDDAPTEPVIIGPFPGTKMPTLPTA